MKKLIALLLALVMVIGLVACGNKEEATPEAAPEAAPEATPEAVPEAAPEAVDPANPIAGMRIGCTIGYKGDEWCSNLAIAMEEEAKKYGCEINVEDGDLNGETQTKQIENMIASGVDMIMIDCVMPDTNKAAVQSAIDAGIPVFAYDNYFDSEMTECEISWDQYVTGELAAQYLLDYVAANPEQYPNGEARVVLMTVASAANNVPRIEGFKDVIEASGAPITIINESDCEGNREKGANVVNSIVEPYDFVVSTVDNGAWGAVSALELLGKENVKVISMGAYGEEPFSALANNHPYYLACVVVPPEGISEAIFECAVNYFNGIENDEITYIDIPVADAKNVSEFYKP